MTFLVLAARWLWALRSTSRAAGLPLTGLHKVIAAAPIAYTALCFLAAGSMAEQVDVLLASGLPAADLPLVGPMPGPTAVWVLGVLVGVCIFTPPVVVFMVESYFARRMPALVKLGRQAVWSMVTGVKEPGRAGAARASPLVQEVSEDDRWKALLRP